MHNLHGFTIHYKFKPDPEIIYKQYYRKSKNKKKSYSDFIVYDNFIKYSQYHTAEMRANVA